MAELDNVLPLHPKKPTVRERFRADLGRYLVTMPTASKWQQARALASTAGVWATAVYRFGQYLREEASRPVRAVMKVPYAVAHGLTGVVFGIHLFPEAEIGPGLYIGHYGGIWISPLVKIGANCNLSHNVTIGRAGQGRGAPTLGDRVWVGPGAIVSGPVKVGDEAVIAANSLVATHVPEKAVMIGVPARVISKSGSGKLVKSA